MIKRLKVRKEVICSVCNKLRIIHYYPLDKQDKQEFLKELASKPYICSDHPELLINFYV